MTAMCSGCDYIYPDPAQAPTRCPEHRPGDIDTACQNPAQGCRSGNLEPRSDTMRRSLAHQADSVARMHWLMFNAEREVVGCHCGFEADMEADSGYGDSVVRHLMHTAWDEGWHANDARVRSFDNPYREP